MHPVTTQDVHKAYPAKHKFAIEVDFEIQNLRYFLPEELRLIKGDTRSLDYSSHGVSRFFWSRVSPRVNTAIGSIHEL